MITREQYVRVSPSQISLWRSCCRAWAYSKVRPRAPQDEFAAFGDRVHKLLENWLQFGMVPDPNTREGACAIAGMHLIPMPPQSCVETKFQFLYGGVVYTGRKDLTYGYQPRRIVVTEDHKTTGDLQWVKTREQLEDDPQWITYGTHSAEAFDVPMVIGQWVYYERPTASKPARAVDSTIMESRDTLRARFDRQHHLYVLPLARSRACMPVEPAAQEAWIDWHPRVPDAGRKDSACYMYRGCPYRGECLGAISPLDRMSAALAA